DRHELAALTGEELEREDPKGYIPPETLRLRALARASSRLSKELSGRPPVAPRRAIRQALLRDLVGVFAQYTGTRPTRVLAGGRTLGRLERFLSALIPAELHDPAVGLDHQIKAAIKEMSGRKFTRSS